MKRLVSMTSALGALHSQYVRAESTLRQVVVISRHGVRGPYGLGTDTPSEDVIKQYVRNPDVTLPLLANDWGTSETDDPAEVVSPKLTKHGYRVVQHMGEFFREHLYRDFISGTACSQAFAYADANQRDNLTAEAFLAGSYPSCKNVVPITSGTRLLFEQGQDPTATCPVCSRTTYEGITGAPDCRYLVQEQHEQIAELNEILDCCTPSACSREDRANGSSSCSFFDIPAQWNGAFYQPWKDSLSSADYFTEFLMLQSLNNMTLPSPFTFDKVLELSSVHEVHMDLVTNEVNSANFGATLLAHVTASFEQRASGQAIPIPTGDGPTLEQSLDNRFLFYAGHDINILYLRNLLRLQWYTRGWHPHQPTPGGMLIFELHSTNAADAAASVKMSRRLVDDGDETDYFVKAFFVTASPEQMRFGEVLTRDNPPDIVPVIIPTCSMDVELADGSVDVRCPLKAFKSLIGRTLKHECVADTLRPFIDSLNTAPVPSNAANSVVGMSTLMWGLFAVLGAVFLGMVGRHALQRQRHRSGLNKPEYGTLPHSTNE